MNAIVSLCHFCELHGPSVVFCTQAFRDHLDLDVLTDGGALEILNGMSLQDKEQVKGEETNLWKYGRILKETFAQMKNTSSNDTCVACRSFSHSQPGFISNDDSARVSYVSSQCPLQSELYLLVREACIRSLSCEVCPGREGPIYFGDEFRGHVLSHTFFLRDVQARGFQRWYSILILMKDKMLLLNSWPFIVRHLRQTIIHLQENASKVYESEETKVSHRALRSTACMVDSFRKRGLSVRQLYTILGGSLFHRMMHHLLIGRQVILRGSSTSVISAMIQSLQPLLPKHCYKAIKFSPHYVDSASCNILGLHALVKVPPAIVANGNLCLIDIISREENHDVNNKSNKTHLERTSTVINFNDKKEEETKNADKPKAEKTEANTEVEDIAESIKKLSFKITEEGSLPPRPPQVLSRIEAAVGNSTLTQSTLMSYISTINYEWINKVKVWIHVQKLKKIPHSRPERVPSPVAHSHSVSPSLPVPIVRSPTNALSRSPVIPAFRSSSGNLNMISQEVAPQDERHQLLAALGSTEWDVPLLEFWAKHFNSGQETC
ncbi:folliculin isoform X2 [Procambarus clarkii]|uniref:folliculin isoform X2 n=1 Tax=Procambarus clarkii TaxID=6728 RepID=UPI003742F44D